MITSIVLTGCYNIKPNANGKIQVEDQILSVEKDIPFVRYRFDNYTETEIAYIEGMMKIFDKSTHLVEFNIDAVTHEMYNLVANKLRVAKFLYADITNEDVQNSQLMSINKFAQLVGCNFDRFMLKDKTSSLDYVTATKLCKQLSVLFKVPQDSIGVCSSPLSFDGMQCLTAVRARELMSIYNDSNEVALPSANHQSMQCCGCIRYMVVSSDLEAPAESGKKKSSEPKEKKTNSEKKKPTSNKLVVQPGMYSF